MITEDYVSFETAKLLKEKGFDECCPVKYKYVKEFDEYLQTTEYVYDGFEKYYYPCPTIQMAMKWLREVHKLYIRIDRASKYWNYTIRKLRPSSTKDLSYNVDFNTYEQACEAAIKYCLKNFIK